MQFGDGGAFADFPYVQYPHGMGKQRAPAMVVSAAAAAAGTPSSLSPSITLSSLPVSFNAYDPSLRAISSAASTTTSAVGVPSRAVALTSLSSPPPSSQAARRPVETAEETTMRTAKGIQESLQAAQQTTEVFDGRSLALQSRQRAAMNKPNIASKALTIVVCDGDGIAGARESDPEPIVRSPTKEQKSVFTDALLLRPGGRTSKRPDGSSAEGEQGAHDEVAVPASSSAMTVGALNSSANTNASASAASSSRKVVVPFCVSSWQNRKKLIVPVEQRLAQQHDDRLDGDANMGDAIVDLAIAMQQASKEVAAEMASKEKAKAEEEERRQAALEAAEAEKARQLLEQKAAELAANAQRRETREQRLERIRLERELREQEKLAKQEQRLRERAATRLNITVEDLEADEQLLKTIEQASTHVSVASTASPASAAGLTSRRTDGSGNPVSLEQRQQQRSSYLPGEPGQAAVEDDDEGTTGGRRKPAVRGGVFASAVISNEGIRREMEALAAVEAQQQQQQQAALPPSHDGIRLRGEDEICADEDEEDGGFQLHSFVNKRQRL
ncbi:hypothetical protein ABL78_8203 [Leptomonas seymouri]|uniref:SKI-interacting protein SKIP SNW domain-containing protein n=1 Tax=Leptomonas seymouri TaxID=5684 RepID=A0A0N1I0X6_LEPSE|nr:hypothetical protein ABL78_8203 [Leptomonas seymouri]|eukprot:KPI82785.1 hypothetical protein ABL78_8203 [Leptomonas seymouri]